MQSAMQAWNKLLDALGMIDLREGHIIFLLAQAAKSVGDDALIAKILRVTVDCNIAIPFEMQQLMLSRAPMCVALACLRQKQYTCACSKFSS
jgi:hypothetical protein